MTHRVLVAEDVAAYVDNEGLGYAVTCGISAESIEDDALRGAWERAQEALQEVRNLLPDLEDE